MQTPRVLKFGGMGLRDGPAVLRAVEIVRDHGGERPVVVVSAHQGVTALLGEALDEPDRWREVWDRARVRHRTLLRQLALDVDLVDRHLRELRDLLGSLERLDVERRQVRDHLLSLGERMSARIVAAALRSQGQPAAPIDAFDLGLMEPEKPGEVTANRARLDGLRRILHSVPGIPVVTGFLATDRAGNLRTLGRNGSDLSAIWVAETLGASEVQLWKTVAGIMTADPRLVPEARTIPEMSMSDAAELGHCGAEVLHPGVVEPALRSGITVSLRDARDPSAPGTLLSAADPGSGPVALAQRAASGEPGLASIALVGSGVGADASIERELAAVTARRGVELRQALGAARARSRTILLPADRLTEILRAMHEVWFSSSGVSS